jgi:hypothetical protein
LEKAYQERDYGLSGLATDDDFKRLRSDPRVIEIMKRMRFLEWS